MCGQCCQSDGIGKGYRLSDDGMEGYSQDGITLWQGHEPWHGKQAPTCEDIINLAKKEPNHVWRIFTYGPLWSRTYRLDKDWKWILEDIEEGYA